MNGRINSYIWCLIAAALGLSMIAGCTNKEIDNDDTVASIVFKASFEDMDPESRTFLDDDMRLCWNYDDRLSLFVGNTVNQQFSFQGEDGDRSGSFQKIQDGSFISGNAIPNNVAVYPYLPNTKISEYGALTVTLPETQTYSQNSFGRGSNVMVAVTQNTSDNFLAFKNVGGYLRFRLYGDAKITSMALKGNCAEKIAGQASVEAAYGQAPVVTMGESAKTSVTLDCGDGVQLTSGESNAVDFWFVLPPVEFTQGFTLTLCSNDGKEYELRTSGSVSIQRNKVSSMKAAKADAESFVAKIKTLQLVPDALSEGLGNVVFAAFLTPKGNSGNRFIASVPLKLTYSYYPLTADFSSYDFVFENLSAASSLGNGVVASDLIDITDVECSKEDGTLTVTVTLEKLPSDYEIGQVIDKVRLCALRKGNGEEVVYSDYANLSVGNLIEDYSLIHQDYSRSECSNLETVRKYRTDVIAHDAVSDHELFEEIGTPYINAPVYSEIDPLELNDYVDLATIFGSEWINCKDHFEYSLKYELAGADGNAWNHETNPYNIDGTDQNMYVSITADGVMNVLTDYYDIDSYERPCFKSLVMVTAQVTTASGPVELAKAYIKVEPIVTGCVYPSPTYHQTVSNHHVDFCLDCLSNNPICKDKDYTTDSLVVTWEEFNRNVLGEINLSYEEFLKEYDVDNLSILVDGGEYSYLCAPADEYEFPAGVTYFTVSPNEMSSADRIGIFVDENVVAPSNCTIEFVFRSLKNSSERPNVGFKFSYSVVEPCRL